MKSPRLTQDVTRERPGVNHRQTKEAPGRQQAGGEMRGLRNGVACVADMGKAAGQANSRAAQPLTWVTYGGSGTGKMPVRLKISIDFLWICRGCGLSTMPCQSTWVKAI